MLDTPKPCDSLGYRYIGDPEPLGYHRAAHAKLLRLKSLRRDLPVDRRCVRVENCRLNRDLRKGSNSLRQCPPSHVCHNPQGGIVNSIPPLRVGVLDSTLAHIPQFLYELVDDLRRNIPAI